LLSFIGYSANEVQSAETLQGIRQTTFLLPMISILGSVAIIFYYPLDALTHQRIVQALQWKSRKVADSKLGS